MDTQQNLDVFAKINEVVDQYIRPGLQADGGDIEIVDFENNVLLVRLVGSCSCCPRSYFTLKMAVENTLKSAVSPDIVVCPV